MQKFRFRNSAPAKVAKPAKATANEGYPATKQLLRIANVADADNEKTETLADISRPVAGQYSCKNNNLSKISRISSIPCAIYEKRDSAPPPAEQKGLETGYKKLWNQAWTLADYVDGDTAPIEQRLAKLPELNRLRDEMAAIERQTVPPAGPDPEPAPRNLDPVGGHTDHQGAEPGHLPGQV